MIFHENCLLADNSREISCLILFRKLGKMSENLSSAAVVIGALRVKSCSVQLHLIKIIKENICSSSLKFGIYRTWVMSYFKHA